jgi:translation initiation factor IF-2
LATKKIRVYELARELGVDNAVVVELSNELKIGVKSHSSSIDEPSADRVRRLADSRGLRREVVEEPEPQPAPAPEPESINPPVPAPAPAVAVEPAQPIAAEPDSPSADAPPEPEPGPPERSRRVVRSSAQPLVPPRPETFERTAPLPERRPAPVERPISPITDKPIPAERPAAAASIEAPPDVDGDAQPSRPMSVTGRPIPPPPGQQKAAPSRGPIGGPPRGGPSSRPAGGPGGPPRSGGFAGRPGGGGNFGGPGGPGGAGAGPGGPPRTGAGGPPGRGGGRGGPGGGPGGGYGGPAGRGRPGGPPQRRRKKRRRDRSELEPASQRLTPADAPVPDGEIVVSRGITVQEFAPKLNRTPADLVRILFEAGEMVTATVSLADEMIELIAETLGAQILLVEPGSEQEVEFLAMLSDDYEEDEALLEPRAPVVTVMGHVDHGKTTLLDNIRHANVVAGEAGGITQSIGAYRVLRHKDDGDRLITFIDTPGHEAFTAMRSRGAQVTDIAVLVVAADDGVMPQTVEAISHARAADVPIVVAVTKIDRENADPTRVRQQLTENELVPEEWGGDTIVVDVSAPTGQGVDQLLDSLLTVADILLADELVANPKKPAVAAVLEAHLDQGRGPVVSALVEEGTLRVGDTIVAGPAWGRVRAMFDEAGEAVTEAGPSVPVEVLGLADVPMAGDELRVAPNDKVARTVAEARAHRRKAAALRNPLMLSGGARLEDVFAAVQRGEVATLNLIVKADAQGSLEAIIDALRKLDQEHDEVRLSFVHRGVGGITESDASLAVVSNATIIGFNVRPDRKARELAEQENVEVRLYEVIYNVLEDVNNALVGMLKPEYEEVVTGEAEVREVFGVPRVGKVAGCFVTHGVITRGSKVRFLRDGTVIWKGAVASLRRFKDDVREVREGFECGVGLENYSDLKAGDIIETFEEREIARV